jgi:hypothetical protein
MEHRNFEFPYDRQKLLDRIKENRDKHVAAYEEAWKGYLIEVAEQLEQCAKDARANLKKLNGKEWEVGDDLHREVVTHFGVNAQAPQTHADEYDRVIDQLAFTSVDEVVLTQQEFNQYVRDEWQWSRMFNETAGTYSAKFRASNA